ncbi:MAG TPA: hypothetical protein VNW53_02335 [Phenylobacterium sp.]|jgi:hypothetical protein|uniref:hypothetical protein n=1 Tax=Phenylobacterium sp. TaxID=1871053 RepID=UPI002CD91410|nr:hypothetical protein [Phenylobacterium sp.]HXA37813.1 hypothetical protein [Phenylobacterium sp.]
MKTLALLIPAVLALASPAFATDASPGAANVASAFGNTIVSVDPDGRSRKIWLQPDGNWTGKSRRGLALAGKWTVKGDKVCMSQSKPRLFGSLCQVFPTDPKSGVDTTDPTGAKVHLKLVKGHVES